MVPLKVHCHLSITILNLTQNIPYFMAKTNLLDQLSII